MPHCPPLASYALHCHQMIIQQQPEGPQGVSGVSPKLPFVSQPKPAAKTAP